MVPSGIIILLHYLEYLNCNGCSYYCTFHNAYFNFHDYLLKVLLPQIKVILADLGYSV